MLHGITITTADMKQISKMHYKINRYIIPCTKRESKFRPIKSHGSGVISIMNIYTSTRKYFIIQLYRKEGKHYQRIARYLGLARIDDRHRTRNMGVYGKNHERNQNRHLGKSIHNNKKDLLSQED